MKKLYASPIVNLLEIYDRQDVLTASLGTVEDCYDNIDNIGDFFN